MHAASGQVPTPLSVTARAQVRAGFGVLSAPAGEPPAGLLVPRSQTRVSSQVTGPEIREPDSAHNGRTPLKQDPLAPGQPEEIL